jgi:hypothetical protein
MTIRRVAVRARRRRRMARALRPSMTTFLRKNWVVAPGSASLRICGAASPGMNVEATAPYEILMPETIVRYGIFAAFGVTKAVLWTRPYSGGRRV